MSMPGPNPDAIADCVLTAFQALPAKCKPRVDVGGIQGKREWVPLAGIVLGEGGSIDQAENGDLDLEPNNIGLGQTGSISPSLQSHAEDTATQPSASRLMCAALATGMKCLPCSKLHLVQGNVVHDWHAEILAIRAFNRWMIDECSKLTRDKSRTPHRWIRRRKEAETEREPRDDLDVTGSSQPWQRPFMLRKDVEIYMYISEAPCGDASMELTMAAQDDDTPWSDPTPRAEDELVDDTSSFSATTSKLLGRGHFSRLGIVRRKPARPDAPPTLSKSCSDKLAQKQCLGLLNGVTSLLLEPGNLYLRTLVLPEDRLVEKAISRAFRPEGRMRAVVGREHEFERTNYGVHFFDVVSTCRRFEFEKTQGAVASNLATLYLSDEGGEGKRRIETLINGVLQGRKQFDPRGASCVSRRSMVEAVVAGLEMQAGTEMAKGAWGKASYAGLKNSEALEGRRAAKAMVREEALQGWVRNEGDEGWR